MNASEARKLMEKRKKELNDIDQKLYDFIIDKITTTIASTKTEIYEIVWYNEMNDFVKKKLEKDGYKVTYNSSSNFRSDENSHTISWKREGDTNWSTLGNDFVENH